MTLTSQFFDSIKSRSGRGPLVRIFLKAALLAWKLARLVPGLNRLRVTLPVGGNRLRVRAFSYDDLLTASPDYEPIVRELAPPPGATAVDAGAFIGRHTLDLARAVGLSGRVIAVEPHPENFALLEENARRNAAGQVTCVACALGRDDGVAVLRGGRETSTAAVVARPTTHTRGDREVLVRSLDSLLATLGVARVDFLKIDVEGAELDVLMGAEKCLAVNPGAVVLVEVHAAATSMGPDTGETPVAPNRALSQTPGNAPGAAEEEHQPDRLVGPVNCPVRQWLLPHGFDIAERLDGARRFYIARRPDRQPLARPAVECQNSVATARR